MDEQLISSHSPLRGRLFKTGALLSLVSALWLILEPAKPAFSASLLERVFRQTESEPLPAGSVAVGSGSFISPTAVLTSAHVIAGCKSFAVENAAIGQVFAKVEKMDRRSDAAILQLRTGKSNAYLGAAGVVVNQTLSISGYPSSMSAHSLPSNYSARSIERSPEGYLVLDAEVPAGMSGGPILDAKSRLVAILTGKLSSQSNRTIGAIAIDFKTSFLRYFQKNSVGNVRDAIVKIRCNR